LVRARSRLTRPAEAEALWQLKDRNFSQVTRELGIGYGTLRRLLEKEIDEETLGFLQDTDVIYLGIDEHSFRHHDLVHTVTEVKQRKMVGILRDDRITTLKKFLAKIPREKVKEVCVDMKDGLRKAAEAVFPSAKVVVDPFHIIADSNKRMDEARRIEQDVHRKRNVQIPKKIFLVGREKLSEEKKQKVDKLLDNYPGLKGFYWAKEKIRELYRQQSREEAVKLLNNIILNLKSADDAEMIRWGNTLKHWREPILNHFDNHTTNGFTEGCNTKIKMLKRISYGMRNVEVYWRKMLLGFVPSRGCFHTI
jgi:transposase